MYVLGWGLVYLHLSDIDWLIDEDPGGSLEAGGDRNGTIVSDVARGVWIQVSYVQTHQQEGII